MNIPISVFGRIGICTSVDYKAMNTVIRSYIDVPRFSLSTYCQQFSKVVAPIYIPPIIYESPFTNYFLNF